MWTRLRNSLAYRGRRWLNRARPLLRRAAAAWRNLPDLADPHVRHFHGQFGEDALLQAWFAARAWSRYGDPARLEPGFYVEVGAFHPREHSNTWWFYRRGWRGIAVEPTPGLEALFRRERPRDVFVAAALSDREGSIRFHTWGAGEVVNTVSEEHAREWAERLGRPPALVEVPCRTLKSVLDEHLPAGQPVHFMSIDCEGHDLQVLRSGDWSRHRPELVLVESVTDDVDRLLQGEVHRFMSAAGYRLHSWARPTLIYRAEEVPVP